MTDIERLSAASDLLSKVAHQGPRLSHEEMYRAGEALSEITYQLGEIARIISLEMLGYPDRFILRDDEDQDPQARIDQAIEDLSRVTGLAREANEFARRYHSAVGHLAVEVNPDAELED